MENDLFAPHNEDRWYTQGMRYSRNYPTTPGKENPSSLQFLTNWWCHPDECKARGWAIGQLMFSPSDIQKARDLDDRPWGGWLYLGAIAQKIKEGGLREDTLEFDLGVIGGNLSGAEWAQSTWHEIIGSAEPAWNNNLENELGVYIDYKAKFRQVLGPKVDFIGHYGADLGNVRTSAYAGVTVRYGCNLSGFGPDLLHPAIVIAQYSPAASTLISKIEKCGEPDGKLQEAYLFGYLQARLVAFNVFLDGNLFRDGSPSVDREPVVADLGVGFSTRYRLKNSNRHFRLTYLLAMRSKEFDVPPTIDRNSQTFGSITFALELPPM